MSRGGDPRERVLSMHARRFRTNSAMCGSRRSGIGSINSRREVLACLMRHRAMQGQAGAARVLDEHHALKMEVVPHRLEVGGVMGEADATRIGDRG